MFNKDTKILMPNYDNKYIYQIKEEEKIMGVRERSLNTPLPQINIDAISEKVNEAVKIILSNGKWVVCSKTSALINENNEPIQIFNLKEGDYIRCLNGFTMGKSKIERIEYIKDSFELFSFKTETGNYFANRILVHC